MIWQIHFSLSPASLPDHPKNFIPMIIGSKFVFMFMEKSSKSSRMTFQFCQAQNHLNAMGLRFKLGYGRAY
jgi:hypothetical protein